MTSITNIWTCPIERIDLILGKNLINISDTDKRILVSQLHAQRNILNSNEISLVNSPFFTKVMRHPEPKFTMGEYINEDKSVIELDLSNRKMSSIELKNYKFPQ